MSQKLISTMLSGKVVYSDSADAEVYDHNFRLSEIADVRVQLNDHAIGACWTNLKEVREYAEEKLRMKGAKVNGQREFEFPIVTRNQYNLLIIVKGTRERTDGSGGCVGLFDLSLYGFLPINNLMHKASISNLPFSVSSEGNFNQYIIEAVSEFISHLK